MGDIDHAKDTEFQRDKSKKRNRSRIQKVHPVNFLKSIFIKGRLDRLFIIMEKGKQNKIIGYLGEAIARRYLLSKGYFIVGKNQRISNLEIDIIAKIKDIYVFIEVKTRAKGGLEKAEDALGSRKIRNLKKFRKKLFFNEKYLGEKIRFDFIAVEYDKYNKSANIKHFKEII